MKFELTQIFILNRIVSLVRKTISDERMFMNFRRGQG